MVSSSCPAISGLSLLLFIRERGLGGEERGEGAREMKREEMAYWKAGSRQENEPGLQPKGAGGEAEEL